MDAFRATTERRLKLALGLGLFLAFLSSGVHAQPVPDAYRMIVISNQAFGKAVLAGNHRAVIQKAAASTTRLQARFALSNNLCVAYVRSGEVDKAEDVCDAAVASSQIKSRRDRAIALVNRGVLRALTDDASGARQDFRAASWLSAEFSEPIENLARLSTTSG